MSRAWIALGSNQGDSAVILTTALDGIAALPASRLLACSHRYRTAPVGGPEQPDFLNAVCLIETQLSAADLLSHLQRLESDAGRVRHERWGPRTLDLDIIAYDDLEQQDPKLTLPHPRAHQRAFVLHPLAELTPQLRLQGKTVSDWLVSVTDQAIERLES